MPFCPRIRCSQRIDETLRSGRRALLITEIPSGARESEPPAQSLVENDGTHVGQLDPGIAPALMFRTGIGRPELVPHNENLFFVEPLHQGGTVFIFGAGHISIRLVPLAGVVGFRTVVLDDRHEFANRERFQTADEIIVSDSFELVMNELKIDENSYLVLVTRGHAHDKVLLRQALGTKAGYIGMIGSLRKRDSIYDDLHKEGFSRHEFDRVCSPIGLDIGAETPEEIAVSNRSGTRWSQGREECKGAVNSENHCAYSGCGTFVPYGLFKPLLPLGRSTVIQEAVERFRRAGIDDIRVVIGHRKDRARADS